MITSAMGHAIVYCWKCQNKLLASDFEERRAFQAGGRTSCRDCVGDLVRTLGGRDREDLLSLLARANGTGAPADPRPSLKSTGRLPTVRTPAAGTPVATPSRAGAVRRSVWIGGIAAALLVLTFAWSLRPSGPAPSAAPAEAEDVRRRKGPEEALAKARAAEAALAREKEARSREWADVEFEIAKLEGSGDYARATDFLRAARGRHSGEDWTRSADRRLAELGEKEKAAALARRKSGDLSLVPRTGLTLWLRGDSGVTVEGSKVLRWLDQSDGHHELSQEVEARRPAFRAEGLNGKACLVFDGLATSLHFRMEMNGLEGLTVLLVSACASEKKGAGGSDGSALYWEEAGTSGKIYLCPSQTGVRFKIGTGQPNGDIVFPRPTPLVDRPTVTVIRKDGPVDCLRTDGVLARRQGGMGPRVASCADRAAIGIGKSDTHFSGRIAEVLLYGRALPDGEVNQVERYLSEKYGLVTK